MLDTKARSIVQPFIGKCAEMFIRWGLSANQVTLLALVIGLIPAIMMTMGLSSLLAVSILWLSGLFDAVDGTIARKTNTMSPFGSVMDITFDRLVEISLLISIAYRYSNAPMVFVVLASSIILSMTIFLTVGAASEKASEKSFYYQPGLAERTEGFILFSLMMIFTNYVDILAMIFSGLILLTACQRFIEAYKHLR
ncbi:CDP-alcohol phosphatidyltransferase family protein [Petrocella sp. FN5]|uniref:CDP-alcohol phosphatidyltransferase family protein n=1 Tax=Petrocella sp. FN5 TaxID=3032002 RepID=UPI0023D992AF|nr:CDP-alcohol phosphatidyltransferase family protein [Petrocella sp. FN5]MDF1615926.1 CDP-alcohol phosphatidyltransferase family protein [Petrocella sp. FN5]